VIAVIGFLYLIMAPLISEGFGHIVAGLYSAIFFKTDSFAWTNGTVILVALMLLVYSIITLLPVDKRWRKYGILADIAVALSIVYIRLNVYQMAMIMFPVGLWYIVHRWGGHFFLKAS